VRRAIERAGDGISVLPVSYDAALQDPATASDAVNRFLGGRLDVHAMAGSIAPQLRTIRGSRSASLRPPSPDSEDVVR
jgi:hypothetical protein